MAEDTKVLLIGGTSHVGKSSLARRLATELGWSYLSTDQLARHPGRPWREDDCPLPVDVVEHYSSLSTVELVKSVLLHYQQNVWPIVDAIVHSRLNNTFEPGLVFEGSAIVPDEVLAAEYDRTDAIWLTGPRELIADRVLLGSQHATRTAPEKRLIEAFLERSLAVDRTLTQAADANGQRSLDISSPDSFKELRAMVGIDR